MDEKDEMKALFGDNTTVAVRCACDAYGSLLLVACFADSIGQPFTCVFYRSKAMLSPKGEDNVLMSGACRSIDYLERASCPCLELLSECHTCSGRRNNEILYSTDLPLH